MPSSAEQMKGISSSGTARGCNDLIRLQDYDNNDDDDDDDDNVPAYVGVPGVDGSSGDEKSDSEDY